MSEAIRIRRHVEIPESVPDNWLFINFWGKDEAALAGEMRSWLEGYYGRQAAYRREERKTREYDGWDE